MWFKTYERVHQLTTTGQTDVKEILVHHNKFVSHVDLHTFATLIDQHLPCGSRVMSIFTDCLQTDGLTQK